MSESAEAIATVVGDLAAGRVKGVGTDRTLNELCLEVAQQGAVTTVDATVVYEPLAVAEREINLYDDHTHCAPPWYAASVCYRNQHGNVMVMPMAVKDRKDPSGRAEAWESDPDDDKDIDWARVRWTIEVPLFLGGQSKTAGKAFRVPLGPLHYWRLAVYDDGELADVRWVHIVKQYDMELWDMAMWTLLGTLDFMGCRNVDTVDVVMSRAERRRLQRAGAGDISVKTLAVFPSGRSSRSAKKAAAGLPIPLTPVKGAIHHYGDCCPGRHSPKGLYFGRSEGRIFVAPHARGSEEYGQRRHNYELRSEKTGS